MRPLDHPPADVSDVVRGHCFGGSVEADESAVGEYPLGPGVAEGNTHADDRVLVVRGDLSDDRLALLHPEQGSLSR